MFYFKISPDDDYDRCDEISRQNLTFVQSS